MPSRSITRRQPPGLIFPHQQSPSNLPSPSPASFVTLTLSVRNSGAEPASHAEIDLQLPRAGMFAETAGASNPVVDLDERVVSWQTAIEAGAILTRTVRLILPRDAGGEVLLPTMRVRQLYTETEAWIHGEADVQTRIDAPAARAFGLGVAPAGLAVIALLVAAFATWAILPALARGAHARRGATVAVVAITIAIGFWGLFASMAWHDAARTAASRTTTAAPLQERHVRPIVDSSARSRPIPRCSTVWPH